MDSTKPESVIITASDVGSLSDVLGDASTLFPGVDPGNEGVETILRLTEKEIISEVTPDEACAGTDTEKRFTPASLVEHLTKDGRGPLIVGAGAGDFSQLSSMFVGNQIIGLDVGSSVDMTSAVTFHNSPGISAIERERTYYPPKQSNHEMCAEINALAGNAVDPIQATMAAQKKIIECEWVEMCASVEAGDLNQLRDDVQDMLFTVYGMAARMGFPADLDFKAVCDSQYSKFDTSVEDALKTQDKYLALGVGTYYEPKFRQDGSQVYVTYSVKDQTGTDNKFYPAGKWLKSVNFKDPVYIPLT